VSRTQKALAEILVPFAEEILVFVVEALDEGRVATDVIEGHLRSFPKDCFDFSCKKEKDWLTLFI
jgi:hypothetical protein